MLEEFKFIPREKDDKISEDDVEKAIYPYLRKLPGWKGWKASDRYTTGVSDRVGCYYGHLIAVEVKRPGNMPTTNQEDFIKGMVAAGGYGTYITSLDQLKEFLTKVKQNIISRYLVPVNWQLTNIWIPIDRSSEIPYLEQESKFKKIYRQNFFWQKGMITNA